MPEKVRKRLPDRPDVAGNTIAWLAGRYVSCE
jgi:hypothetical protein